MVNPNPKYISAPLWWFVEKCTSLTATAFSDEYGGTYANKAGYHNTRDNLLAQGKSNDYSIRDSLNKQGPGDKTAAFDWTFPSAQGGNYQQIVTYSSRVKVAWEQNDPRCYALAEVLCEADFDYDPEGYVFYPSHYFRVPDRTHKWHIHFSFIRKYLNDQAAFEAIFSIIVGEALAVWQARVSGVKPQQKDEDEMLMFHSNDDAGTTSTTDDKAVFLVLQGGHCRVKRAPEQTLANKLAGHKNGSGDSVFLSKAEWNDLMDWYEVEGNRFVRNADGTLGDWVAEPAA